MAVKQPKWQSKSWMRVVSSGEGRRIGGLLLLLALGAWAGGPLLIRADAAIEKPAITPASPTDIPLSSPPSSPSILAAAKLAPSLRAALERTGDTERGREAFSSCAVCHLSDGSGRSDGTFPQLAGQHPSVIIKQLVDMRERRRVNPLMLHFAERLSGPQEVADVALYVSGLPTLENNGKGTGSDLELGADLYSRDCASCHGVLGEGDADRLVPVLARQHYGYVLRQIRDIGGERWGKTHPQLALAGEYSDAEIMALADHASRIRDEGLEKMEE